MLFKKSFKSRLILSYIIVVVMSFGFAALFIDKKLEENALANVKSSVINQAYLIESQLSIQKLKKEDASYLEEFVKNLSSKINCRITIIDINGKVLADSEKTLEGVKAMDNHLDRPEVKQALEGKVGQEIRFSATLRKDMLYVATPIKEGADITGVLRLALALVDVEKTLSIIRRTSFVAFLFAIGFAFMLGSVVAERVVLPIKKIILVSRRFSRGDFDTRIHLASDDEIGELASTLNTMAQDIEEKIKAIDTQNQQLKAIFNSMIEGVIAVDKKGRVASINPTIEKIFNISKKDAEGRYFLESIPNTDISEIINSVFQKGELVSKEISLVWPVHKIFQINALPIFEKSQITGCLVVIHDITEIRKLEVMRRDFVTNVSHEFKTPLTSIKGFVETLLEGALEDKEHSRQFLKIIQDHAEQLNNLVGDLLSLSHIESREIKLEKEALNLKGLVDKVLLSFKSQLNKKSIGAQNLLSADLIINADKDKLGQVFTNLIDNAIKFNKDNGSIKIYSEDLNDKISIIVEDSGVGIPEKHIPRIFERFYMVDKARSKELGGTGLGLSIVKHVIELHKGGVGVESAEGFGSKFFFILPK